MAEDLHLGIGVDMRDFAKFAKGLNKANKKIHRRLMLGLRGVGKIVADEARRNIEPYSRSVPDSIRVRISGATVSVIAGGAAARVGALLELGNRSEPSQVIFRHPCFGDMAVWADQLMHPFLGRAVQSKAPAVEQAAIETLDEIFGEIQIR